jgi:hypothetical protein
VVVPVQESGPVKDVAKFPATSEEGTPLSDHEAPEVQVTVIVDSLYAQLS